MEMNKSEDDFIKFMYNEAGIRTSKNVNGVEHIYTLDGSRIVSETVGNVLLVYVYDESGAPIGLQYRTASYEAGKFDTYYFEKNIFGDIVAVYTDTGTKIGSYTYDAWGNCTVSLASGTTSLQKSIVRARNPFRYRGYYYDTEIGLYYLQSRYYNPATGRFINADGYANANGDLIGFNMYTYCSNNPVMFTDPSGELKSQGEIHHLVVNDVAAKYGMYTNVYLEKYGVADLIDIRGELDYVYEVKPMWYLDSKYYTRKTSDQIDKYVTGVGKVYGANCKRGNRWIAGTFGYGEYQVVYFSFGTGVISYYYFENKGVQFPVTIPEKSKAKYPRRRGNSPAFAIPIMIPFSAPSCQNKNICGIYDFRLYQCANSFI